MYTAPAYVAGSCGYDGYPGYTHVHRDKQIVAAMRGWMHLQTNVTQEEMGLPLNC